MPKTIRAILKSNPELTSGQQSELVNATVVEIVEDDPSSSQPDSFYQWRVFNSEGREVIQGSSSTQPDTASLVILLLGSIFLFLVYLMLKYYTSNSFRCTKIQADLLLITMWIVELWMLMLRLLFMLMLSGCFWCIYC